MFPIEPFMVQPCLLVASLACPILPQALCPPATLASFQVLQSAMVPPQTVAWVIHYVDHPPFHLQFCLLIILQSELRRDFLREKDQVIFSC